MNNKTKVLKILDKHRDMSLTAGCEVFVQNYITSVTIIKDKRGHVWTPESDEPNMEFLGLAGSWVNFDENHIKEILGHPATPLTLLKALDKIYPEKYNVLLDCQGRLFRDNAGELEAIIVNNKYVEIPLTTTLQEIPESDPMWQAVLEVLI